MRLKAQGYVEPLQNALLLFREPKKKKWENRAQRTAQLKSSCARYICRRCVSSSASLATWAQSEGGPSELWRCAATDVKSEIVFWLLSPLLKDILLPMSKVCGLNSDNEILTHDNDILLICTWVTCNLPQNLLSQDVKRIYSTLRLLLGSSAKILNPCN